MVFKLPKIFNIILTALLVFQLTGCGTLLYPERRGQIAGRLDVGIVVLDGIGLLFAILPGVIAFAVDFSNGCIYLPAHRVVVSKADLKVIKFDPKHTSLAQIEKIIQDQTGFAVDLTKKNVRISRLRSTEDMMEHFAQAVPDRQDTQLASLSVLRKG
jgi:hypothetical protein